MEKREKGKPTRKHQVSFLLNDEELKTLDKFCKKYKIKNRSLYIRKAVFANVIMKLEIDYPKLFPDDEMDQLIVNRTL